VQIPFACVHCGKNFTLPPSVANRRKEHTCSLSCARSHWPNKKRAGVTCSCEVCGDTFYVAANRANKARFCSDACKNISQKKEGHPMWKGGVKRPWAWRQVIIDRQREVIVCEECGAVGPLHGHHIKPVSTHPELGAERTNIIVLCALCHSLRHPEQAALILSHGDRLKTAS
jgi:hypothetical protein